MALNPLECNVKLLCFLTLPETRCDIVAGQ